MIKRSLALALVLLMSVSMVIGATKVPKRANVVGRKIDTKDISTKAVAFTGTDGGTFDKSANGYGWYWSNSKRVQVNMDPETGPMLGSIYRRLDTDFGTGTLGGVVGAWDATFNGFATSTYTNSPYQTAGTNPGSRFPQTTEFINGYIFGLFTDMNLTSEYGTPMFIVGDATFGWDLTMWSQAKRIEATEGGAFPTDAWTAKGDVAYNPDDGYYYWTTWWDVDGGSFENSKLSMAIGRSNTPADPDSWEWTDYNDLYLDCSSGTGIDDVTGLMEVAYAKDIYGNGTGYGIVVGGFLDDTYIMTNLAGDTLDVTSQPRLGYMYTTNWGADWSSGDFKPNWNTPGNEGTNMFNADIYKLFDWYGSVLIGDSIGVDGDGNAIYEEFPMNWPYMSWNTHVVVTENNMAHVMLKVFGCSSTEIEGGGYYLTSDEHVFAGYYDIVGEITESGVIWHSANYIASPMGLDNGEMETNGNSGNTMKFSNGYAGNGVVYATWLDRPESRYLTPSSELYATPDTDYIDDAFFSYSPDDGRTWALDKTVVSEGLNLKYAFNVTKTNALMDEGWTVANHGTNIAGTMTVYAACQYNDLENPIAPPIDSYRDYQQFLKFWKITGTETGIETEEVSMVKDFTLYQNYPNPFNPATEIKFSLQNDSDVKLSVFNIKGEMVANLKNERMVKGVHAVNFDASSMNSGVYFYKLQVGGRAETKKMVLTK